MLGTGNASVIMFKREWAGADAAVLHTHCMQLPVLCKHIDFNAMSQLRSGRRYTATAARPCERLGRGQLRRAGLHPNS